MAEDKLSKIVSLCRRRGFVFGGSEIYGGVSSIWDYGPLGAKIKKRIKDLWWKTYVESRPDIVGLDCSIITHEDVFKASGHLEGFNDMLVDCTHCKKRFRLDKIEHIKDSLYKCECGKEIDTNISKPRKFNLMLRTNMSAIETEPYWGYLRPETAQGIFCNFQNVLSSTYKKLPLGIAQIGKSFRNEVTGGSFIFRMKEFEQMEIEYFCAPEDSGRLYEEWVEERYNYYINKIGLKKENIMKRPHAQDELAHYARGCTDIEYLFPFGWSELEGIANRTDYDLSQHAKFSKKDLTYFDQKNNRKFIPFVIEPSAGVDRTFFAVICDAFCEEEVKGKIRTVLKLKPSLAAHCVAILPLLTNRPELVEVAKNLFNGIKDKLTAQYDDTAAIGKLYRRQDEIGTPFCVTVDVDSLTDKQVTVRDRDTMAQERISMERLIEYVNNKITA
jgi:glycyl-tRNA synthetase